MSSKTRSGKNGADTGVNADLLKRIEELEKLVEKQGKKIEYLESQNAVKSKSIDMLHKNFIKDSERCEELEQYGRRDCLRIHGVEVAEDGTEETADDVFQKVGVIAAEVGVTLNKHDVYRAHRIGKVVEKNGKRTKQIIVKFRSWNARCAFYKARPTRRKNIVKKSFSSISVDLTKSRLSLLSKVRDAIKERYGDDNDDVFVFSDINCRLVVRVENQNRFFNSIEQLNEILGSE